MRSGCGPIARVAKSRSQAIETSRRAAPVLRQGSGLNFPRVFVGAFAYKFFMSESFRLKDQPVSERPRERLVARGPDALTHAESQAGAVVSDRGRR